ncbi:MAG TPA: hypothetical protein VFD05_01270 [Bacilli bacterium]|nr:hypothetical protein [Bacilli bacterium]
MKTLTTPLTPEERELRGYKRKKWLLIGIIAALLVVIIIQVLLIII